jgi:parallel beta-helix repeat protein
MYKKGVVFTIICLFIGASIASSANSTTSTVNSKNIFHSTVFKGNDDRCYNRIEVWKDFPYKAKFPHNGDGWYDEKNDTLHLIEGVDIEHINEAIDLVCEYGTVYIHSGDYYIGPRAIILNKPLNFNGEDKNTTTLFGKMVCDGIIVSSWYVNITNFTISNSGSSAWLAGIKVEIFQISQQTVNIYNNILSNNYNGIYVEECGAEEDNTSINISKNEIFNNVNDGMILCGGNNTVRDNKIFNNNRNGIGFWGAYYNIIENNDIYNNSFDGIWNDKGNNNKIRYNKIIDNGRHGITFYDSTIESNRIRYCTNNEVYNNTIKLNNGGIFLYHSNGNEFHHNDIEDNTEFGFKILHFLKRKDYNNAPSSTDNRICHNNFINNGDANGVDAGFFFLADNAWDSGEVLSAPDIKNSSQNGGNYWSDYCDRYDHSENNKKNGVWTQKYEMFIQLVLNLKGNVFFYTLHTHSFTFDKHPWCKKYGWIPTVPEIPHQPIPDSESNGNVSETLWFYTKTTDLNEDNITYLWNWSDGSGSESPPSYPGEEVHMSHYWTKSGTYYVTVKAIDEDDKNGSNWSIPLKVEIG